jgi:hypothetical protein
VQVVFGDVVSGIFGLGGVVLGGLLTVGTTYGLERRRAKRARDAAIRLAGAELTTTVSVVTTALDEGEWQPREYFGLPPRDPVGWSEQLKAFATALSDDEWHNVVYAGIIAAMAESSHKAGHHLTDDERLLLEAFQEELHRGLDALGFEYSDEGGTSPQIRKLAASD